MDMTAAAMQSKLLGEAKAGGAQIESVEVQQIPISKAPPTQKIGKPFYSKWWFWTFLIGAAGGGAAYYFTSQKEESNKGTIMIEVTWPN